MSVRDRAEYALFRGGVAALRALPVLWSRTLLRRAGKLAADRRWWRADVAEVQLAQAFPDLAPAEVEGLVRGLFRHLADSVGETFVWRGADPAVRTPGGPDPLARALSRGRGVILASLHLGNFELCGRAVAGRCDLLDVVKPQRNPLFDRYLDRMRRRHGIATVPMDRSGPAVLAHLRKGGVVSLLLDQDAGGRGVTVDFLGRPASTWPGAARLSLQTGCPVLPVCLARGSDGVHDLVFGSLLDPARLAPADRDPTAYTALITAQLEGFVRRWPGQWFWVHRRWKGADKTNRRPQQGPAVAP